MLYRVLVRVKGVGKPILYEEGLTRFWARAAAERAEVYGAWDGEVLHPSQEISEIWIEEEASPG